MVWNLKTSFIQLHLINSSIICTLLHYSVCYLFDDQVLFSTIFDVVSLSQYLKKVDIIMGAATVAENSLKATTTSLWGALPRFPSSSLLNFDLTSYNRSFVNFAVVVGALAIAKSALCLTRSALNSSPKVPTRKQLLDRYGHLAWGLIADCKGNEEYVSFLAKNGFNLILMGEETDIERAREQARQIDGELQVVSIPVDWAKVQTDVKFYEGLLQQLKEHDVAFLVLPKLKLQKEDLPTHLEIPQPFQHIYLLVRFFGHKLKFRSYKSAIIFPSYPNPDRIAPHNGLTQGLIAGSDAFGRIIGHELKGSVEVVVARGSVENAFIGLGTTRITQ